MSISAYNHCAWGFFVNKKLFWLYWLSCLDFYCYRNELPGSFISVLKTDYCCLDSIIHLVSTSEISKPLASLYGWAGRLVQTPKDRFSRDVAHIWKAHMPMCQTSPDLGHFLLLSVWLNYSTWAATWQNQQNDCTPSKDSDQPCPVWSEFAVRMKKAWVLRYPLTLIRLSLCWTHMPLRWFCLEVDH